MLSPPTSPEWGPSLEKAGHPKFGPHPGFLILILSWKLADKYVFLPLPFFPRVGMGIGLLDMGQA